MTSSTGKTGPQTAMVLAAGLGKRMRPITETIPKPLVKVAGKPLLDWGLDALEIAGVGKAVVNVHYLADQIETHLAERRKLQIVISDERDALQDSAGGIIRALPQLGGKPFYILNADTFWIEGQGEQNLQALADVWDDERMDILLMVADLDQATGYEGTGDFTLQPGGRLLRARDGAVDPVIYAGAAIIHPRIFADSAPGVASLNRYFDGAIAVGRLYGMPMQGHWLTVGTPDAIAEAEAVLAELI